MFWVKFFMIDFYYGHRSILDSWLRFAMNRKKPVFWKKGLGLVSWSFSAYTRKNFRPKNKLFISWDGEVNYTRRKWMKFSFNSLKFIGVRTDYILSIDPGKQWTPASTRRPPGETTKRSGQVRFWGTRRIKQPVRTLLSFLFTDLPISMYKLTTQVFVNFVWC